MATARAVDTGSISSETTAFNAPFSPDNYESQGRRKRKRERIEALVTEKTSENEHEERQQLV